MYEGQFAETVSITGAGGDVISAYLARPLGAGPFPGVVVIHHMPGWDEATKEITRRFAHHGYVALCHNLHHRAGPDASPDDAAAATRAAGGVPDERFLGDTGGAIAHLRALPYCSGRIGVIGYCSGGRQSFLTAASLPVDAAVVCYGAAIANAPPAGSPFTIEPVLGRAPGIECPVLGLFGEEDTHPAPDEVHQIDEELTRLGKQHEFHLFANAGHGFFATDRDSYRVQAARDGWQLIWRFFEQHLGGRG
jgi:carboxymethylenebutenolidase